MVEVTPLIRKLIAKDPEQFTIPPYDVIGDKEKQELYEKKDSAINIILPKDMEKLEDEFRKLQYNDIMLFDGIPGIFLYRQESKNHSQEGMILAVSLKDYESGKIKVHELTRKAHLEDRVEHIAKTHSNTGLVWTMYQDNKPLDELSIEIKSSKPLFDFEKYGYRQTLWKEENQEIIGKIQEAFKKIDIYIADGHHRIAAANAYRNKVQTPEKLEDYVMVYASSEKCVKILPYNRIVKNKKISTENLISRLKQSFNVKKLDQDFKPLKEKEIGLYTRDGQYSISPRLLPSGNSVEQLDVAVLQKKVLEPHFGIYDPTTNPDIEFIGGTSADSEGKSRVDSKEFDYYFSLYPVTAGQIMDIADNSLIMPPKSTWFEPKLLTGFVFNMLK